MPGEGWRRARQGACLEIADVTPESWGRMLTQPVESCPEPSGWAVCSDCGTHVISWEPTGGAEARAFSQWAFALLVHPSLPFYRLHHPGRAGHPITSLLPRLHTNLAQRPGQPPL